MAGKRGRRTPKIPHLDVTLGFVETDELPPTSPPRSPDPFEEPSTDRSAPLTLQEKISQLKWSDEMTEALVECIYGVWKEGRAAENGFKKDVWVETSEAVMRIHKGPLIVGWDKCKNKWGDLKKKWKHWVILS